MKSFLIISALIAHLSCIAQPEGRPGNRDTLRSRRHLSEKPIIPEADSGFRAAKTKNRLRTEVADYNFDGCNDYRIQKSTDTSSWNYFICSDSAYVEDTFLSRLDHCLFDFTHKTFSGSKTTRTDPEHTRMDFYSFMEGRFVLLRQLQCVHAFPHSERMDCSVYELENGEMVFKELIKGCE